MTRCGVLHFVDCCATQAPLQQWPPYASYVLLELWCKPSGQAARHVLTSSACAVRVLFNGKILRLEQFGDSESGVPLPEFVEWANRKFSSDQTAMQCALSIPSEGPFDALGHASQVPRAALGPSKGSSRTRSPLRGHLDRPWCT